MSKSGKHYFFDDLEFYAERGMVSLIDTERAASEDYTVDQTLKRLRPGDFLKRVISVRMSTPDNYSDKHKQASKLLEEATIVVREAMQQGDPLDPAVQAHNAKHYRHAQIAVPSRFQKHYKITQQAAYKTLWEGAKVVDDRSSPLILP